MNETFDIEPLANNKEFYLRFYNGGYKDIEYGHEFLEFDIRHNPNDNFAIIRYANQSNYRNEELIKREIYISILVFEELLRILRESQILLENDKDWPQPLSESKQELEIRYGKNIKILKCKGLLSLSSIKNEKDVEGLKIFYYHIQDLKVFIFSLISLHFKVNPLQN
jgi:protein mago nashi